MSGVLSELLATLPDAISSYKTEAKAKVDRADASRDAARDPVKKLGGDIMASQSGGPESDENAAFTVLEDAAQTFLGALQHADNAVAAKVALIKAHEDELRERQRVLELKAEADKAPPVPALVGSSLVPDAKFDLDKLPVEIQRCLTVVKSKVEAYAKQPMPDPAKISPGSHGQINNALALVKMEQIGRGNHWLLMALQAVGRAFGTDIHVPETLRQFREIMPRLIKQAVTLSGVELTWWRMSYTGERPTDIGATNKDFTNDKENGLGMGALADMIYTMFENLSARPELLPEVEAGMKVLLLHEQFWWLRTKGVWRFPRDRVQHPFAIGSIYYEQQRRIAERDPKLYERVVATIAKEQPKVAKGILPTAKERVADCAARLAEGLAWQEAELDVYENGKYGDCTRWAYNVWMGSGEKQNADMADNPQPSIYLWHMQTILLQHAFYGLGRYTDPDFQRALSRTMYWITQPTPLKYRLRGEDGWKDTVTWINAASEEHRWVDSKGASGVKKASFNTPYGRRTITYSPHSNDGYFERGPLGHNDYGMSLIFAEDRAVKFTQETAWGTPDKPKGGSTDIGFLCAYAIRLGLEQGVMTWD